MFSLPPNLRPPKTTELAFGTTNQPPSPTAFLRSRRITRPTENPYRGLRDARKQSGATAAKLNSSRALKLPASGEREVAQNLSCARKKPTEESRALLHTPNSVPCYLSQSSQNTNRNNSLVASVAHYSKTPSKDGLSPPTQKTRCLLPTFSIGTDEGPHVPLRSDGVVALSSMKCCKRTMPPPPGRARSPFFSLN